MKRFVFSFILISLFFTTIDAQKYHDLVIKSADFIEQNKLDSAEVTLKRAMALDPANADNAALLISLGVVQRQLGKLNDAYISFSAALNGFPDSKIVLHNRASLLYEMNRPKEAMDDYNEIIRQDPANVQAYYRKGLLYLDEKNRAEAENVFAKAWKLEPSNFYSLLSKALIFKLDNNWEEAAKIYDKLIETEKENLSKLYLSRAECMIHTGKMSLAAADLQSAEKGERDNPYFYFLRGQVRLSQMDKLAAKGDFEKALSLGYDAPTIKEWIKKAL